eukprot:8786702-Prorocentrum_lima.AAC.1
MQRGQKQCAICPMVEAVLLHPAVCQTYGPRPLLEQHRPPSWVQVRPRQVGPTQPRTWCSLA